MGELVIKGMKEPLEMMEIFCIFVVVIVTMVSTLIKLIDCFLERVNFLVWKLDLNEVFF
jgi:hypothetical protein